MRCIIIFSSNNLVKTLAVYAFSQKEILPMQVLQINKQEFKLWKYGVYVSYLTNLILQKKQWERQISYDTAYMWKLKKKNIQMNLFTKQKQAHRLTEQTYDY